MDEIKPYNSGIRFFATEPSFNFTINNYWETSVGKERIRRAGTKIVEDNQNKIGIDKLDIGFRVYKTGSSNMKKVYYHPEQLTQDNIFSLESNIKEDRSPDDLLTQVILNLGLALNLPIEQKKMHGNSVFIVQTNALVACFDDNINIKIAGSRYFCESLFWASQPKPAAKT